MILLVVGIALALGAALVLLARPPRAGSTGDLEIHRLADGVYIYRGHFSNSAVLVTTDGVLVVDTQVSPLAAKRLREKIESVTQLPVRFVANTHYHGDHTGGNELFPEAEIIATEQTARFIHERDGERVHYCETFGLEVQEIHPTVPPTRTFAGRTEIDLGGEKIEIRQIGRSETPDACIVHWPSRRTVAVGDGVATLDYPYLGVPFLDEGLRDDGSWIGFLKTLKEMRPEILIPGHGPAIVGAVRIQARLDLLISLMTDLLSSVRLELKRGTAIPELVRKVDGELRHYAERPDLQEDVTGQRFAIYRCINNLIPERAGKGWWDDLRPSVIRRAERFELVCENSAALRAQAGAWVSQGNRPLAISALESWLARHPADAAVHALLSDIFLDGAAGVRPRVDAMEYVKAATQSAKRALRLDPSEPVALLNLGIAEVFGAMVLAQSMSPGIGKLKTALRCPELTGIQVRKGAYFLGKAFQYDQLYAESDRWFRRALPGWARPLFPLLRNRLRHTA